MPLLWVVYLAIGPWTAPLLQLCIWLPFACLVRTLTRRPILLPAILCSSAVGGLFTPFTCALYDQSIQMTTFGLLWRWESAPLPTQAMAVLFVLVVSVPARPGRRDRESTTTATDALPTP